MAPDDGALRPGRPTRLHDVDLAPRAVDPDPEPGQVAVPVERVPVPGGQRIHGAHGELDGGIARHVRFSWIRLAQDGASLRKHIATDWRRLDGTIRQRMLPMQGPRVETGGEYSYSITVSYGLLALPIVAMYRHAPPWRSASKKAHYLCHSFASRALALGENLPMIGRLLGHSELQATERYAHLDWDWIRDAAVRISESIAADVLTGYPGHREGALAGGGGWTAASDETAGAPVFPARSRRRLSRST